MTDATTGAGKRRRITMERTFDAPIEDVWELWTTKEGIESWWGPEGFTVTVHAIDLRPGGEMRYEMRATAPDVVEGMKRMGMPLATEARLTYREIAPHRRLAYLHAADFVPGVAAYDIATEVELFTGRYRRPDGGDRRRHARRAVDRDGRQGMGEPARQGGARPGRRAKQENDDEESAMSRPIPLSIASGTN